MAERQDEDDQDRLPRQGRGRGRAARRASTDGEVERRRSSTSSSRPASSRPSCAAAAFTEAPDITARICGICPVAYQMSAVQAMEDACGVEVDDGRSATLRRLLYCGEWIESHALHVYMLHAPDFLGYAERDRAGPRPPELVEQALAAEEGRQRADDGGRRPRDPSDQRQGRGLLPRPDRSASWRRSSSRSSAAREIALDDGALDGRASTSPTSSVDYELVTLDRPGRIPDRPRTRRLEPRAWTSPSRSTTSTSSRSRSRARTRCTRG